MHFVDVIPAKAGIQSKAKPPGATRQLITFLDLAKKCNRKKSPPVCRPSGALDQPQASGAAQLALVRRTPRATLRSSNSARLPLRFLAADRSGAQGKGEVRKERIIKNQSSYVLVFQDLAMRSHDGGNK